MDVQLRILQGRLKQGDGEQGVDSFHIRQRRFKIGSGSSCHMVCKSRTIAQEHCILYVDDDGVFVHDLGSETGTFLNDRPVTGTQPLHDHDKLRVGRLEFEVVIAPFAPPAPLDPATPHGVETVVGSDTVETLVNELLEQADDEERQRRHADPAARYYHVEPPDAEAAAPPADETEHAKQLKRPERKPVGKLPPQPGITADDSTEAAQKALHEIFHPKHRPR